MLGNLTPEEICRKLKPILGDKIDKIYLNYTLAEREARQEIEQALNLLYRKHLSELLDKQVLLEPPKDEVNGEYPLAKVSYANKELQDFCLKEKDWIRHVCISGMSGSGKTNLAFNIIENFIKKEKPFFIFDWKKSFRPLMLADNEIKLFTVGNERISNFFKININKPPKGVSPKEWLNTLADLITESFYASYGVHKLISETLDEAFREAGVYKGSGDYPTWYEIRYRLEDKIKQVKGREANWLESALRIAHVLTFGDFGKVINCKGESASSIDDLLGKKIIFEMSSLSNIEKTFFSGFLLTYIYKLKKAGNSNERFEQAILVDEAHNIFLKERPIFVKETVTDSVYREIREYGVSLICLDQHISKLSPTILGNSACHIAFQQQLPDDIKAISRICLLERQEEYFSRLPVGNAIVKLAENFYTPFLIHVELSKLKNKKITDKEIKEKMEHFNLEVKARNDKEFMQDYEKQEEKQTKEEKKLDDKQTALLGEVKKRLERGESKQEIKEFLEGLRDYAKKKNKESPDRDIKLVLDFLKNNEKVYKKNEELTEDEEMFLDLVRNLTRERKEYSTTEIYKALKLSARKGNKIKNKLLDMRLIRVREIKDSKGRRKIIES